MNNNFFFLSPCPQLRRRQHPRCLLSIFHAGVLGLQAQGSLHEKLKYLFASNLLGAHPLGGGRMGWVRAAAPARLDGKAALAARPDWRGLPTAPNLGGAEGGSLLVDDRLFSID